MATKASFKDRNTQHDQGFCTQCLTDWHLGRSRFATRNLNKRTQTALPCDKTRQPRDHSFPIYTLQFLVSCHCLQSSSNYTQSRTKASNINSSLGTYLIRLIQNSNVLTKHRHCAHRHLPLWTHWRSHLESPRHSQEFCAEHVRISNAAYGLRIGSLRFVHRSIFLGFRSLTAHRWLSSLLLFQKVLKWRLLSLLVKVLLHQAVF